MMRNLLNLMRPVYNAPDDGGQGAGGAGDQGAGEGGQGGAWSPPEGLPQDFVGADANETLGKLLGGYNDVNTRFTGMRDKLAGMPKAPESVDGYVYEPSDKLKPYFGDDLSKNPAFDAARNAALKHGMSSDAFAGFIEDTYSPLVESGALAAPYNPANELKTFQDALGLDRDAAGRELQAADTFAKGLVGQLKGIPESMQEQASQYLLGMTDDAVGNVLLKALAGRLGENGIRVAGEGGQPGVLTESEVKKLDSDPRIDPTNRDHSDPNKRFDPELRKQYDEAYKKLSPKQSGF